jgi:hypothetical protein
MQIFLQYNIHKPITRYFIINFYSELKSKRGQTGNNLVLTSYCGDEFHMLQMKTMMIPKKKNDEFQIHNFYILFERAKKSTKYLSFAQWFCGLTENDNVLIAFS